MSMDRSHTSQLTDRRLPMNYKLSMQSNFSPCDKKVQEGIQKVQIENIFPYLDIFICFVVVFNVIVSNFS